MCSHSGFVYPIVFIFISAPLAYPPFLDRAQKEFPNIRSKLWQSSFWSRSYCLLTLGGAPLEIVRQYIENQGGVDE